MRRRKKGKGTIYRRIDGKWRGQFWLGDERKSVTGKTKKDVEERIKFLEIEARNRLNKGKNLKYGDFLDNWLETKQNNVTLNTWSYYRQLVRDYVKSSWGFLHIPSKRFNPEWGCQALVKAGSCCTKYLQEL